MVNNSCNLWNKRRKRIDMILIFCALIIVFSINFIESESIVNNLVQWTFTCVMTIVLGYFGVSSWQDVKLQNGYVNSKGNVENVIKKKVNHYKDKINGLNKDKDLIEG